MTVHEAGRVLDLRMIIPAVVGWAGVLVAGSLADAGHPWPVAVGCWIVAGLLGAVIVLGRRRQAGWVPVAATVLVSMAVAGLLTTRYAVGVGARSDSPLRNAAEHAVAVEVTVWVTGSAREVSRASSGIPEAAPSHRMPGLATAVGEHGTTPVPVVLTLPASVPPPTLGSEVVATMRVGAFPPSARSAFSLRATSGEVVIRPPPGWLRWAEPLRDGLRAASSRIDGDAGALVPGLAIGDTSRVPQDLNDDMQVTSLSHLSAVSGANCALITGFAFWLTALLRWRRGWRIAVAATVLVGFVVLVTPEPSVIRAAVMGSVVLLGLGAGRPGAGLPALSIAVVLLLAVDPGYARDVGFALSAAATAGLLVGAAPIAAGLARVCPRFLARVLALPIAAQLACQPVLLLLRPTIPVYSVPANLLCDAAAPIATAFGVLACLVLPVLPSVGYALVQVAAVPAGWIAGVAHVLARAPAAELPWIPGLLGAGVFVAALSAGIVAAIAWQHPRPWISRIAFLALMVLVAAPLGVTLGPRLHSTVTRPASWDLAQCDVGQGDAVMIRAGGAVMVIDAGRTPDRLAACLDVADIHTVDVFVATHWDTDHVGGASALRARVRTVWHGPHDGDRSARVLDPLRAGGAGLVEVAADWTARVGEIEVRVLWPPRGIPPGNGASVVVSLTTPGFTGVFLGDLGATGQRSMLALGQVRAVDLVKVSHHGSADQAPELYRVLSARVGLIGVGADNDYGHPTRRTLDLLTACGTAAVRSDQSGTVMLAVHAGEFTLWSTKRPP